MPKSLGAKSSGVEMGGRSPDEEKWAQKLATGLRRALAAVGVLKLIPEDSATNQGCSGQLMFVICRCQGGIRRKRSITHTLGRLCPKARCSGHWSIRYV